MEKTVVPQLRTRIGFATAKNDSLPDWEHGSRKQVYVSKMKNGRLGIYKGSQHFKENSGYRTYDSIQDLEKDFNTELIQEAISF